MVEVRKHGDLISYDSWVVSVVYSGRIFDYSAAGEGTDGSSGSVAWSSAVLGELAAILSGGHLMPDPYAVGPGGSCYVAFHCDDW